MPLERQVAVHRNRERDLAAAAIEGVTAERVVGRRVARADTAIREAVHGRAADEEAFVDLDILAAEARDMAHFAQLGEDPVFGQRVIPGGAKAVLEVLGVSQAGTMNSVGVSHYLRILKNAVAELKAGATEVREEVETEILLPVEALIPTFYVPDSGEKIAVYQKLASAEDEAILKEFHTDLKDEYGDPPKQVEALFSILRLKLACRRAGVTRVKSEEIGARKRELVLTLAPHLTAQEIMQLVMKHPEWRIRGNQLCIDEAKLQAMAQKGDWLGLLAEHVKLLHKAPKKKAAKDDCLQREQLPAWFEHVRRIHNPVIAAYLQTALLTGARREEVAGIRWEDVDFQWKAVTIKDKVDGERTIPLTPYVAALLASLPRRNEWVFSSPTAETGRLQEPRIAHNKALAAAGLPALSLHGLRRSFGTLAEWVECPAGISAQIMGHKPSATAEKHYRRRPLDLLRQWHTQIEGWILHQAGIEQPGEGQAAGLRVVG